MDIGKVCWSGEAPLEFRSTPLEDGIARLRNRFWEIEQRAVRAELEVLELRRELEAIEQSRRKRITGRPRPLE